MNFKKRLAALLLVLVLSVACFIACGSEEQTETPSDDSYVPKDYGTATVYSPWDRVQIITENAVATQPILDEIDRMTKDGSHGGAYIGSLYSNNAKLEVLVGIEDIDGSRPIIEKAKNLLKHFGTVAKVKTATRDELCSVKGITLANAMEIEKYYKDKNKL